MLKPTTNLLYKFLTALFILAPSQFSYAQVCKMLGQDKYQGRQGSITLDFSMHRGPDELAVFAEIMDAPGQFTPDKIEQFSGWLRGRDQSMNLSEQSKRAALLTSLVKNKEIEWIGIEYSPSEINDRDEHGRDGLARFNFLKKTLNDAKLSPELTDRALLLFSGSPARYVWYRDAQVRQLTRLVPLDSDNLKSAGQRMLADVVTNSDILDTALKYYGVEDGERNAIFKNLNEAARSNDDKAIPSLATGLNRFGNVIQVIRIVYSQEKTLSDFLARFMHDKRVFADNQKARDSYVAGSALSQAGNGWISFGDAHAENLKRQIENSCYGSAQGTVLPNSSSGSTGLR